MRPDGAETGPARDASPATVRFFVTMTHHALGGHPAVGDLPPTVVRQAPSGLRGGPSGAHARPIRTAAGGRLDGPSGGIVAGTGPRSRRAAGRTDAAASR